MLILNSNSKDTEQKFIKHMTSHEFWNDDIRQIQKEENKIVIGSQDIIRHHGQRLICPRCERGAFRHMKKDMAKCPVCGWFGKAVTVDEYLTNKLYR